jgi:hypothetical protein
MASRWSGKKSSGGTPARRGPRKKASRRAAGNQRERLAGRKSRTGSRRAKQSAAVPRRPRRHPRTGVSAEAKRSRAQREKPSQPKFTVPEVYRKIVKKNERQTEGLYDVLICGHSVPAATDNTFRKARACPECRIRVQEYADAHLAQQRAQQSGHGTRATRP